MKGNLVDKVFSLAGISALYRIPFALSTNPTSEWVNLFIQKWDHPASYTSMHRPGIACVVDKKIYLNGNTIEEVQKYHCDTPWGTSE